MSGKREFLQHTRARVRHSETHQHRPSGVVSERERRRGREALRCGRKAQSVEWPALKKSIQLEIFLTLDVDVGHLISDVWVTRKAATARELVYTAKHEQSVSQFFAVASYEIHCRRNNFAKCKISFSLWLCWRCSVWCRAIMASLII